MLACLEKGIRYETATVSAGLSLVSWTSLLWNMGGTYSNNGHVLYMICSLHNFEQMQDGLRTIEEVLTSFYIFNCRGASSMEWPPSTRRVQHTRKHRPNDVWINTYL
jgi:hypothetical protein